MTAAKRSISFDPDLLADAERLARNEHGGNLSALVNAAVSEALARQVKLGRLDSFLRDMEREHGPVPDEVKVEVDAEWEGWESRSTAER